MTAKKQAKAQEEQSLLPDASFKIKAIRPIKTDSGLIHAGEEAEIDFDFLIRCVTYTFKEGVAIFRPVGFDVVDAIVQNIELEPVQETSEE